MSASQSNNYLKGEEESWGNHEFLTIHINDQLFGIPVLQVQDVLGEQKLARIPLASPEVAGALNLRGRIVTAIDVKKKLGLIPDHEDSFEKNQKSMSVVIEHEHELYSLIIDKVGYVLSLNDKDYEPSPATLDPVWRDVSDGIYRLNERLLVVLDVSKLLGREEKI